MRINSLSPPIKKKIRDPHLMWVLIQNYKYDKFCHALKPCSLVRNVHVSPCDVITEPSSRKLFSIRHDLEISLYRIAQQYGWFWRHLKEQVKRLTSYAASMSYLMSRGSRFGSWRQFWVSFRNMQRQKHLEETLLTLKQALTTYPSIHFPSRPESIVKLIKVCSSGLYILQTCMYIYASWKDRIEFTIGWMLFDNGSKDSEDMQDIKVKLLSLLKGKINSA